MLPQIPADKANHFIYGAAFFALVVHLVEPQYALLATAVLGVAKEIADVVANERASARGLPPPHGVELLDAVATTAGGVVCFIATASFT